MRSKLSEISDAYIRTPSFERDAHLDQLPLHLARRSFDDRHNLHKVSVQDEPSERRAWTTCKLCSHTHDNHLGTYELRDAMGKSLARELLLKLEASYV